ARRGHVADQRGRGDDRGTGEITPAAETHAVLPVAVERRDRAPPRREGGGPPAEARTAPPLPDLTADPPEGVGDRLTAQARRGLFDLTADAAGARKDPELAIDFLRAGVARGAQHERGLQGVVVAAVGTRSDHRLVEGDPLARDLFGGKRVAGAERLRDH